MLGLTWQQWAALVSGFMVMLVQGSLYVYGTMSPYLFTYLYYQGETDLQISELSIINTLAIILTNVGMFFSNFKIITFSHRTVSLIGVLGIALTTFLLSFCKHFTLFILLYGVVFGLFIGYGYLAPLKNCFDYLPTRKGLCSGTCLMGFGLGAFFFNFVLTDIVNPDNVKQQNNLFPQDIANNLPFALQILSAIYVGLGIIGVVLSIPYKDPALTNPLLQPEQQSQRQLSESEQSISKANHYELKVLKYAFTHKIHLLLFILGSVLPYGFFIAFHFKEYGALYIKDDHFLSLLGSIGSIGNGLFRMILGVTIDVISFRKLMIGNLIVFMITCGTVTFSVQSKITYLITIVLSYGCYGSLYSIFPTQTVRILGKSIGSKMYYITFFGFSFGAIVQYVFHRILVEKYKEDGYTYCFIIFGVLLVVGFILVLTIDFQMHEDEKRLLSQRNNRTIETPIQKPPSILSIDHD